MKRIEHQRIERIIAVERAALAMRYVVLVVLGGLLAAGELPLPVLSVAAVCMSLLLHNAYAHWALWSNRHTYFTSPLNFGIYFIEAYAIIAFTGQDDSPAYVLYILILTGMTAYTTGFLRLFFTGVFLSGAYLSIVAATALFRGEIFATWPEVVIRTLAIILTGWLLGRISAVLRSTEREARERARALASSEATLRAILNSAADPIVVFAENELVVEANDRACEFLGVEREDLIGQRMRRFLFDDGTLPTKTASLRARGDFHGEQLIITADGEERTVDFVVRSFIRDEHRLFVALAHDVTEKKELQETNRLATANLERLNRELRQMDQLKTTFLASIAQKLRTPLAALIGHIEALAEEELGEVNPDQRKALQACRRSTLKMLKVVDDALRLGQSAPQKYPETENAASGIEQD